MAPSKLAGLAQRFVLNYMKRLNTKPIRPIQLPVYSNYCYYKNKKNYIDLRVA